MTVSVCLCACLSAIISSELQYTWCALDQFFVHVTCGRGSVLFWWRSDTLCTSGFMDDGIFAHKQPRLLDVGAQLKSSAHAALGLAINCVIILVAGCGVPAAAWPIMTVCSNSSGVSSSVGSDRTTRRSGIYIFMYSYHQQHHASSSYYSSS